MTAKNRSVEAWQFLPVDKRLSAYEPCLIHNHHFLGLDYKTLSIPPALKHFIRQRQQASWVRHAAALPGRWKAAQCVYAQEQHIYHPMA